MGGVGNLLGYNEASWILRESHRHGPTRYVPNQQTLDIVPVAMHAPGQKSGERTDRFQS